MPQKVRLERVKKAWDLRAQGRTVPQIASIIGVGERMVQNYLSASWLVKRGLERLRSGNGIDANELLVAPIASAALGSSDESCQGSPTGLDIGDIRQFNVPVSIAPQFLLAWRSAHSWGVHIMCLLWTCTAATMKAGLPLGQAMQVNLLAFALIDEANDLPERCRNVIHRSLKPIVEAMVAYKPWEGADNQRAMLTEVRLLASTEATASGLDDEEREIVAEAWGRATASTTRLTAAIQKANAQDPEA